MCLNAEGVGGDMEIKEGHCPKCGTDIWDWIDRDYDRETMATFFNCDCGFKGAEVCTVKFLNFIDDNEKVIK